MMKNELNKELKKIGIATLCAALFIITVEAITHIALAQSPKIYTRDGKYLGNLNNNPYDPNSVANPYGQYGSPYSPDSINNQYGNYGSPYSNESVTNPYATESPMIIAPTYDLWNDE